jgi:hypothetical protein
MTTADDRETIVGTSTYVRQVRGNHNISEPLTIFLYTETCVLDHRFQKCDFFLQECLISPHIFLISVEM